jgi:hypothetical protein
MARCLAPLLALVALANVARAEGPQPASQPPPASQPQPASEPQRSSESRGSSESRATSNRTSESASASATPCPVESSPGVALSSAAPSAATRSASSPSGTAGATTTESASASNVAPAPVPPTEGATSGASPTQAAGATAAAATAARAKPRRPLDVRALALDIRHALSLRQFIETTPIVVGGFRVYLEAEPIAVHQRPQGSSQLTVAVAHDKVVVIGAF